MTSRPKFFDAVNAALIGIISILCILPMRLCSWCPLPTKPALSNSATSCSRASCRWMPTSAPVRRTPLYRSYMISIIVTVVGTILAVTITSMAGYTLAAKHPLPQRARIVLFITMVFNTGLVPWYLINLNLGMNNTIWALIIPSLVFNPFNLFLVRNYMSQIPPS